MTLSPVHAQGRTTGSPRTGYGSGFELVGDLGVLAVSGDTDVHAASRFRGDLDRAIASAPGDLVLDLSHVNLVDSTAVEAMLDALTRLVVERRSMVLVVTRGHVLRIFRILGLDTTFRIAATRGEALRRLAATGSPSPT